MEEKNPPKELLQYSEEEFQNVPSQYVQQARESFEEIYE